MEKLQIPEGAQSIVTELTAANYEAYVVGGCVRDSLLGIEPKDWDICTSATPDEMKAHFRRHGIQTIDTGLKHGTITVSLGDGESYEVTTFRVDGNYSDSRHPDSVLFVDSIYQDLARRDFTINAMAYNSAGLVDPFHGRMDLEQGIVACVGEPDDRFSEDALRILRALRFASTYSFQIDSKTAASIHKNKRRLKNIAAERIRSELCKILCGDGVFQILTDFSDIIAVIIPELEPYMEISRNNRCTVYEHISHAVANYKGNDVSVKTALLLHDIGKPFCCLKNESSGEHAVQGSNAAETVMNRLRFDNKTKREVLELILYHDAVIEPTPSCVKHWLNRIGEHRFSQLLNMKRADIYAHGEGMQEIQAGQCAALAAIMSEVLKQEQCFSLKDLAIRGSDIMASGVPEGKIIGDILQHILDKVINGELENRMDVQLRAAKQYWDAIGKK